MSVYVVSADCGDYYCGCGLGHLLGVALTAEEAERLRAEGEAATHRYETHGEEGREFKSFYDVGVEKVSVGLLLHEPIR